MGHSCCDGNMVIPRAKVITFINFCFSLLSLISLHKKKILLLYMNYCDQNIDPILAGIQKLLWQGGALEWPPLKISLNEATAEVCKESK